jgi:glycosyl transferase family 25
MTTSGMAGVIVISRQADRSRRARFEAVAADAPVPWTFFDARTAIAAPLQYDDRRARRTHGRTLTSGEIGAYASHYAVWGRLLESNQQQMIVLEDDVVVDWPFIAHLAALDFSAMGIPYIRLFTKIPARFRKLRSSFIDRYHYLIRFTSYALGAQAYIITRAGAEHFMRRATQVDCPVDTYMDKHWRHGVPNLALYPFPVFERFDASTIGETRFEKQPIPAADRLPLFVRRLRDRFAMVQNALGVDPSGFERALLRRLP